MKQFVVDAFTDRLFSGNQAAVCIIEKDNWLPESLMQNIARENNFSETAFVFHDKENFYKLRWFTPGGEIDFCGHATLGTAFVLFNFYCKNYDELIFDSKIGKLYVTKNNDLFEMNFPINEYKPLKVSHEMEDAIGAKISEAYLCRDLMLVLENERTVRELKPDFEKLKLIDGLCIAVTAKGDEKFDTISRVFAPKLNVKEDPVTGSTHCMIAPFWAERLGKNKLISYQASERGGFLFPEVDFENKRIKISGKAVLFAESNINLDC